MFVSSLPVFRRSLSDRGCTRQEPTELKQSPAIIKWMNTLKGAESFLDDAKSGKLPARALTDGNQLNSVENMLKKTKESVDREATRLHSLDEPKQEMPYGAKKVALLMGPGIPVVNVMTVAVHSRWGEGQNPSLRGVTRSLLTNPLLVACVLGLAINLSGLELPPSVMDVLTIIGRGALGVTLMCVGAGLDLKAISAKPGLMAAGVAMKLLVAPLVFIGIGLALGLQGKTAEAEAILRRDLPPEAADQNLRWLAARMQPGQAPSPAAAEASPTARTWSSLQGG